MGRGVRGCALLVVAVALLLGSAPTAGAVVHVEAMIAKPITAGSTCSTKSNPTTSPQSGAYTDFCLALALNGHGDPELGNIPGLGDDAREITMSLAPGQIGSPKAAPMCTLAKFRSTSGCAVTSQVGDVTAAVEGLVPLTESLLKGKVFNLEPEGTEAARLGLQIEVVLPGLPGVPAIKLESAIRLDPVDGGLVARVLDQPREFLGIPIELRRLGLRLWGSTADHPTMAEGFTSNPTDCSKPAVSKVEILSYAGAVTQATDQYTPTDCATLPYAQSSKVITNGQADAPTEVTADVQVPAPSEPRVFAHVKEAKLVLPAGFELSPAAASDGTLAGCSDAQFDRFGAGPANCPAGSVIGSVTFDSPVLPKGAISGQVFMGDPVPGKQLRFFATAALGPQADAVRVKIEAVATVDQATGQLTTELTGLPPVPFTSFRFTFRGGPTAIVASPRACGNYTEATTATPFSGQPPTTTTSTIVIDQNCGDPARFAPVLGAATVPSQAGADTSIITTLARPDGHARIASAVVAMPPGLLGRLGAAAQCPLVWAAIGNCPSDTKIGTVVATAGPGPQPLQLPGEVYLTQGIGGDPAGLTITANAKFGPLDLGKIVVPGRLQIREPDKGLNLVVTSIPQRVQGISAAIRALEVRLDKPGFAINATNCAPMAVVAQLGSDLGGSATVSAPYRATGCENLPFKPKLEATVSGGAEETDENGHPGLTTTLTQQPGEANTKKVELVLPKGISIDSERIDRACKLADFEAGRCAKESVLGKATATTPLLNDPLAGPVTMVSIPGVPLPELRIQLAGILPITLGGKITVDKDNRLVTVVEPVPDVPLSRFDLSFNGGDESVLQANTNLCGESDVEFDGTFVSQAGPTFQSTTEAEIPGCGPTARLRVGSLRGGRPTMDLRVVGARHRVRTVKLLLPKGMAMSRASIVKKHLRISAKGLKKGSRARVTVSGYSIRITVPKGQSAQILRLRMGRGAVRASTRLRRRGRPQLTFRITASQRDAKTAKSRVRARPARSSQAD